MVRPKKHLGQHFLKDLNIARKIVDALQAKGTSVLEVGPGTGVLTQFLIQDHPELFVIDVDGESIEYLKQQYPSLGSRIIHDDFLTLSLETLAPGSWSIIGNFPYNISSQIFFRVLEQRQQVTEVVGMIQKEVAQRIASPPGSKEYGILRDLVQA